MNATEKVVQMPDRLNRLANGIKADLANAAKSREAWTESMVAAAIKIAQARALNVNNIAFGEWWDAQRFGLGHQDRAALVAMGDKPDEMRKVFSETTRSSIQLIFAEHKGRFTSTSKTPDAARKPKPDAKRAADATPAKPAPPPPQRDDEALPKTAQAKLDAAIARETKRLEQEFEASVQAEGKKRLDELILPAWQKKIDETRAALTFRKGVFTKAEFNKLRMVIHPDHVGRFNDPELTRQHTAAWVLFDTHKLALLNEKEMPLTNDQPWTLKTKAAPNSTAKKRG